MGIEIERKFLVTGNGYKDFPNQEICQGYLSRHKDRIVRVRVLGDKGVLTIKDDPFDTTRPILLRQEFEYEVPVSDALKMLGMCDGPVIRKRRYFVPHQGLTWEVDEFFGDNEGLIIAELELETPDQVFEKPEWVGQDVSSDTRYYNSNLIDNPYKYWKSTPILLRSCRSG